MTTLLTNAAIVLPDEVITGTVVLRDGRIDAVDRGISAVPAAIDLDGDFLLPGAIDLHTDNLERQVQPRTSARWPSLAAFLAHDAHCATAGITTVLDALCVGDLGFDEAREKTCLDGIADLDSLSGSGLLKSDHFLHLRCELPAQGMPALLDRLADHPALRLVSVMDHTPGIGQYGDLDRYRRMRRADGEAAADTERRIAALTAQRERWRRPNRDALLARIRATGTAIASHDDRTEAEIAENLADGIGISEFPVTVAAARAAREGGMATIAGAPNLVRGGSHSGNVAAADLLRAGLVDALASDYAPCSLLHAAFIAAGIAQRGLPRAIALASAAPAALVGLGDRGRIAIGLRADLVRVRVHRGVPAVRQVWREGVRVV